MDVWEKAEQNTNTVERKLLAGTMESSLFNWKGKTCMGCPGKQTALYCNHISIHNMLTRKICRPFFSVQTRFLFPLPPYDVPTNSFSMLQLPAGLRVPA